MSSSARVRSQSSSSSEARERADFAWLAQWRIDGASRCTKRTRCSCFGMTLDRRRAARLLPVGPWQRDQKHWRSCSCTEVPEGALEEGRPADQ